MQRGRSASTLSAFNGTSFDFVGQTALTAFSFNIGADSFGMGDVVLSSSIIFDSTVNPPTYLGGAAIAATNTASDNLIFFPSEIIGGGISSMGTFVAQTVSAPEPATVLLLAVGLGALLLTHSLKYSEVGYQVN